MSIRNYMRLTLLDDSQELDNLDPITGEEVIEEELAERTPEEDAQAAGEAIEELAEAQATDIVIEQLELKALRLEDAAEILDNVEASDEGHVALARTVADLVADGDVEATDSVVNPDGVSAESMLGGRLTTQGFKDAALRIWKAIQEFVKKLWANIEGFFYKMFNRIPKMRRTLDSVKKRLDKAEGNTFVEDKITITSGTSQMLIGNQESKSFAAYQAALVEQQKVVTQVFVTYGKRAADQGENINKAIEGFDFVENKLEASINAVADAALTATKSSLDGVSSSSAPFNTAIDLKEYDVTYTKALPGNIALALKSLKKTDGSSALAHAAKVRSTGLISVQPVDAKDAPKSITLNTPKIGEVRDSIVVCEKMLNDMESFYRGSSFKKIKENKKKIEQAGDKLNKMVAKMPESDATQEAIAHYRAALSFSSSYASGILKAFSSLSSTSMTACSFVAMVGNKTASASREKK